MKLGDLEEANTKRKYKGRDGESLVNIFKYWQPFSLHFHSCHQVDNHNNRSHSPIFFLGLLSSSSEFLLVFHKVDKMFLVTP